MEENFIKSIDQCRNYNWKYPCGQPIIKFIAEKFVLKSFSVWNILSGATAWYTKLGVWGKRYLDIECEGNCLQECIRRRSEVAVWVSPRRNCSRRRNKSPYLAPSPPFLHTLFIPGSCKSPKTPAVGITRTLVPLRSDIYTATAQQSSETQLRKCQSEKKNKQGAPEPNAYPKKCMNPGSDMPDYKLLTFTYTS